MDRIASIYIARKSAPSDNSGSALFCYEKTIMGEVMEDEYELRLNAILDLITRYGGIGGAHHKQWVLDQIVQEALGRHSDAYQRWIAEYEYGEDGPNTYEWDTGIAP